MKIAAALILTATASTCSQPSEQAMTKAREQAIASTAEAMCREGGRASALSNIAVIASETPQAGVGQTVFETASDIEQTDCTDVVKANEANWQKQDALMADMEAAK